MRIERGSDFILKIRDDRGNGIRVANKSSFFIKVFTTDKNNYLEYSKDDVIECGDFDTIYISSKDLSALESGVIAYTYGWGKDDTNFDDGEYNKIKTVYTSDYYKGDESGAISGGSGVSATTTRELKEDIDKINEKLNAHTITVEDNTLYIKI